VAFVTIKGAALYYSWTVEGEQFDDSTAASVSCLWAHPYAMRSAALAFIRSGCHTVERGLPRDGLQSQLPLRYGAPNESHWGLQCTLCARRTRWRVTRRPGDNDPNAQALPVADVHRDYATL
jgi:hypothetical protein